MRFALRPTFPLALALALAGMSYAGSTAAASQIVEARHTQEHIRLDGRLDEPAWRDASMAVELVQQSPHPAAPTPFKTSVRILIADDTLYFGFECVDPEPGTIAVHTMARDGCTLGDDTVSIVLDTSVTSAWDTCFESTPPAPASTA